MLHSMYLFPIYVLCNYNINPTSNEKFNWYRKCIQTGKWCTSCTYGSAVLQHVGCFNTTSMQYTQHTGRPTSYLSKFRNNLQTHNHFYITSLSYFTVARDEIHKAPLHINYFMWQPTGPNSRDQKLEKLRCVLQSQYTPDNNYTTTAQNNIWNIQGITNTNYTESHSQMSVSIWLRTPPYSNMTS